MAKVIGVHRLALNQGVSDADFEEFMQKEVFPGLQVVIQVDKTISHEFTLADWRDAQHLLLRSDHDDKDGNYLWVIVAEVADEGTAEARVAVGQEAQAKAQEFFDLGSNEKSIAAMKLKPFATRTSFTTFFEVGRLKL
jgi:hypothetical protein